MDNASYRDSRQTWSVGGIGVLDRKALMKRVCCWLDLTTPFSQFISTIRGLDRTICHILSRNSLGSSGKRWNSVSVAIVASQGCFWSQCQVDPQYKDHSRNVTFQADQIGKPFRYRSYVLCSDVVVKPCVHQSS